MLLYIKAPYYLQTAMWLFAFGVVKIKRIANSVIQFIIEIFVKQINFIKHFCFPYKLFSILHLFIFI